MNQTFTKYATMRRLLHFSLLLLLTGFVAITANAQAVPDGSPALRRYWVGASDELWSNSANWSLTSGGAGGASVPAIANTAIFDANSANYCLINVNASVNAIKLQADFTNAVIQDENINVTARLGAYFGNGFYSGPTAGQFRVSGGNFTVESLGSIYFPSTEVIIDANTWLTSGEIYLSSLTTTFGGNINMSTTCSIVTNGGTVILSQPTGTGATVVNRSFTINGASAGTLTFDNFEINALNSGSTWNIPTGDLINVVGTLDFRNGKLVGLGAMATTSQAITVHSTFDGLETTLTLNGDDPVNLKMNAPITTQSQGVLIIDKTSPTTVVEITKDLPGALVVMGNANGTMRVTSGTVTFPNNFPVLLDNSLLDIRAAGTFVASTDVTTLTGSFTNAGTFNANGGDWIMSGPVNSTYNASVETVFNTLTISKSTGIAMNIASGAATVQNAFAVTSGSVNGVGAIHARGPVTYTSAGTSAAQLHFTGSAPQTVDFTGVTGNWNGPVVFNQATASTISLLSPWLLDAGATQTTTFTSGIVESDATNFITFGSGNTVAGGSSASFINGPTRKTGTGAFTFPIGKGTVYAPARITGGGFTTALGSATYDAEYFPANPQPIYGTAFNAPLLNVSTVEYWNITKSAGADAFVWVSYDNTRSGGAAEPATLRIANNAASTWSEAGSVLGTGNGATFVGSGVAQTTYPAFTLASLNPVLNPLPVTWLNFTGRYNNGITDLNWTTSMEKNNDVFTIERSSTGHEFTALGTLPGKGNASINNYYIFQDVAPLEGDNYYRIKQTDFDGTASYSKTIRITAANVASAGLKLYPNPVVTSQQLTLENATLRNKKVAVFVISANGTIVRQQQVTFGSDSRYRMQISNLSKGSYFLRIQDGDKKLITPFIVQ